VLTLVIFVLSGRIDLHPQPPSAYFSMHKDLNRPPSSPQPLRAYSLAMEVNVGRLMYIAVQVALDAAGDLVGRGDAEAQTRQGFRNNGQVLPDNRRFGAVGLRLHPMIDP